MTKAHLERHLEKIDGQIGELLTMMRKEAGLWDILLLAKSIRNSYRNFYHRLLTYSLIEIAKEAQWDKSVFAEFLTFLEKFE